MSLKEYIEKKNHLLITTSLQEYSENLQADLASLLLKPTEKTNEAKKNSISLNWLYKKLSEIHDEVKNDYVGQGLMNEVQFMESYRDIVSKLFSLYKLEIKL